MRSHTRDDLPGRCKRCWIRTEHCVCADIPALSTRVQVLLVRHHSEARKSTGTARVAALALPSLRLVDFTDDPEASNAALPALDAAQDWVLYPDDTASEPASPPRTLVVVDGTWRQTRKMLKKLPKLDGLPRLRLTAAPPKALRLRGTSLEEGRSTLEALADALALLGDVDAAQGLHALHALYVERVLKARGVWDMKRAAHVAEP